MRSAQLDVLLDSGAAFASACFVLRAGMAII